MAPRFARSLSAQFDVDELAGRLSPVLLEDQTVALFALAEHVGGDQADELARRVVQRGYRLANPARYVLAAPLLLAIAPHQVTALSLSSAPGLRLEQSKRSEEHTPELQAPMRISYADFCLKKT